MQTAKFESLESRRHLHADLSVAIKATTIPDNVLAGIASKPLVTQVNVTNTNTDGHAVDKTTPAYPVSVGLRNAQGEVITLGTAQAKTPNLKAGATKVVPVKVTIPANLPAGTYTLVATVTPPESLEDTNTANNSASGKTVTAAAANTDIVVAATSSASGSVESGAAATVRATLTNNGNVASKATGTVEITATTGGTTTVLASVANVRLNLKPGKAFSSKPIAVKVPGSPGATTEVALGARLVSATGLIADNPDNNTATAATHTLQPPPPSPFTSANPTVNLAGTITFKRTSRTGARGNFIELGTFTDSNGRTGKYDYRITTAGIVRHGILFSNLDGTPFMTGQFNSAVAIGGKTLTFSTTEAGSAGSLAALGTTFFYRIGR
jgi:hypothetical protein